MYNGETQKHLEKLGLNKGGFEKDKERLKTPYNPNQKKTQNTKTTHRHHTPTPQQDSKIDLQTLAKHTKKIRVPFRLGKTVLHNKEK